MNRVRRPSRMHPLGLALALVTALVLAPAPSHGAPPGNDNFASATDLGSAVPATGRGSNLEATTEVGEPVGRDGWTASGTVWWKWTAPATGRYRLDLCGTLPAFTATLGVFTGGSVSSLTNVAAAGTVRTSASVGYPGGACSDTTLPALAFDATAGQVYRFAAGGTAGSASANLVLQVSRPAANDNFVNAPDLGSAVPATGRGTNVGATTEAGEPVGRDGWTASGTVWWKWTAPASGRYRLDLCDTLPAFTATLGVFTGGSVSSLTNVAVSGTVRTSAPGRYPGGECADSTLTALAFDATAGQVYQLAAGGTAGSVSTNLVLRVSRPAVNDNFLNATDLGSAVPATVRGTNVGATTEAGEPLDRSGWTASSTVWWKWKAPSTGRYRLDLCSTLPAFTSTLAVFTGPQVAELANATTLGTRRTPAPALYPGGECADASLQALMFRATAGQTYHFAVGSTGGANASSITLRLTSLDVPAPSAACVAARATEKKAIAAAATAKKKAATAKKKALKAKKKAKKRATVKNKKAAKRAAKTSRSLAKKSKAAQATVKTATAKRRSAC